MATSRSKLRAPKEPPSQAPGRHFVAPLTSRPHSQPTHPASTTPFLPCRRCALVYFTAPHASNVLQYLWSFAHCHQSRYPRTSWIQRPNVLRMGKSIPIVSVCSSARVDMLRRPTQQQVDDGLTEFFGNVQSPRWWIKVDPECQVVPVRLGSNQMYDLQPRRAFNQVRLAHVLIKCSAVSQCPDPTPFWACKNI